MDTKYTKTGECLYRDPDGSLWRADSYTDAQGNVTTQSVEIEPAPAPQEQT